MADLNIGNSSASVVVNAKHNGSVTPQINNTYDLGTSELRWKNIYGNLKGNADTATTATNDSAGQQINTTYIKGLSVSGKTITYTKGNGATGTITTQDTNTWRGIQNNLTSTSTTDSLSAAQGKILNETKAVNKTLTNEDLNTVTTPGFYNAGGGNSVINKPSGVEHFGLIVVHNANGTYYTQNIFNDNGEWKRTCTNGTWSSWINVTVQTAVPANAVFTDTVYTHPTSSGNKHIPSGGSSGQILRWSADGTAVWGADNNTTYSANTGIKLNGTTFQHTNSVTAGTAQGDASKTLTFGGTFTIPTITYDAQGHITGKGTTTMTMPANPNTDTHWTTGITAGATGTTSNSATTNGNTFIKIKDNSTHRGQIKLVGSGATSVSSDANGVITISSTDNNTTYGSMSVSEGTTGTATSNRVLTAANLKGIINAHAPTKTGGGASGTWGISISGNAATASKVNNKLTVGSKSYDGSAAITIEASDLGLASAMLFLGTTTTAITDGATTNPVAIGGSNKTVTAGNVVLYGSKEFVWTGSAWEELGNEGSYKIVQAAVADPSASGTSNTFIDTISQDTNGKITATKKTVAVTNSAPTLAWGTTSTIGTVAGTNLQVKMPANPNTDTKVTQTVTTSNATYPLLLAPSGQTATTTTTSYFDSGVTLNPSTNTIAANVSGNAATATNVAWSGIINKPSYYDIPKYTSNIGRYGSSDTHILKLGYWNCTGSYDNLTLLVSSSFWGNQHGSTDIITLRQDLNDNSGDSVKCSCNRVKLMSSDRTFYYNIDQTNRRVYLYVYVTGGNSYGKWNTSVLQSDGGSWVSEFAANQPNQSSFVTISEITATAINADAFVKRAGDTMTGTLGLAADRYNGPSGTHGMNCNNSDIVGINGLFTSDNAESFGEGLNFSRDSTTWDAMAASNGTFYFGSNVGIGTSLAGSANIDAGGATFRGNVYITPDTDVGLNQNGSLVIGSKTGSNIGIDGNEIMARENGAAATLYLQTEGGSVYIGTRTTINERTTINSNVFADRGTTAAASFVWNRSGPNYGGIGYNGQTSENYFGPCNSDGTWTNTDTDCWTFRNRIKIVGSTSANMGYNTGNPRLIFAEGANIQQVGLVYSDWDDYRASKGLRIMDVNNEDTGNVWLEVQGHIYAAAVHGAVWNDYAEYRSSNITEPGRVVIENGDGTLSLSTERLQRGAEIISDTFGFAIGETDECKTPIAVSGRVLAYYSGDIKEFKPGYPVCSGPNGTVSIMTEEEEEKYPSRIIGTVSEIPTYKKWGTGNVEVSGRIWIRIR